MSRSFIKFNNVGFTYESSTEPVFNKVSFHIANGWTGVVGANGSGKSTLMKLACGILTVTSGNIEKPVSIEYCEQRTDKVPANLHALFTDYSKASFKLIDSLQIKEEWLQRWDTTSHGERKRCQIAAALWANPDILAIDEPTNHLDNHAKQILITALKRFQGIGMIVSHDRSLLDELCSLCLFVENGNVEKRSGGITEALRQYEIDKQTQIDDYNKQKDEVKKLHEEFKNRQKIMDKNKQQTSKRNISRKDHDAKAKIDAGRLSGKDAIGGKLKRQMQGRLSSAESKLSTLSLPKQNELGITYKTSKSSRDYLFMKEEDQIILSENKTLFHDQLVLSPNDRIALTGANGTGKSTLIKYIVDNINIAKDKLTYIPQEISKEQSVELVSEIKSLSNDQLGQLLIIVSRLGSDAKRILDTESPSPGETRKLLLALGILREPELIIMDEPTNHMDLPSITCLEEALSDVNCALLLVSHDRIFLEKLCSKEWEIVAKGSSLTEYTIKVNQ